MTRPALAIATSLVLLAGACQGDVGPIDGLGDDGDDGGGGDSDGTGDGTGDGEGDDPGDGGDDGPGGDLEEPDQGFQLRTPDLAIAPGEEVTYCYYATLPNDGPAGLARWESRMSQGSHHMILYFVDQLPRPEGTLDDNGQCGLTSGDFSTVWTYAAQDPEAEFAMPEGVGMAVRAHQPVIIQMHYLNASDTQLDAHVTINGHTYDDGVEYQQVHAYVTFNDTIAVPPGETGAVEGSCAVPAGARFIAMSTHSHRFSTRVEVKDGDTMLVETTNWDHPAVSSWTEAPYYEFGGRLDYRCEYFNDTGATVRTGDSAETDEMCMAVGYFFGGSGPIGCLNSFALPI